MTWTVQRIDICLPIFQLHVDGLRGAKARADAAALAVLEIDANLLCLGVFGDGKIRTHQAAKLAELAAVGIRNGSMCSYRGHILLTELLNPHHNLGRFRQDYS